MEPKHGTWGFVVSAGFVMKPDADGKLRRVRLRVSQGGFSTMRAAQAARNAAADALAKDKYRAPSRDTLAEYITAWLPRREHRDKGLKA